MSLLKNLEDATKELALKEPSSLNSIFFETILTSSCTKNISDPFSLATFSKTAFASSYT